MGALADTLVTVPLEENLFVVSWQGRVWQQFGSARTTYGESPPSCNVLDLDLDVIRRWT